MSHDILFQLAFFFLLASAQIAAALTGFIGVVFVLGERARGLLDAKESSAVGHFVFAGMGTLFIALLTAILLVCFASDEVVAWRFAAVVNSLFHLYGTSRLALELRRKESGLSHGRLVCVVGLLTGTACGAAAIGDAAQFRILIVLLASVWGLGVTVVSFVSLLGTRRAAESPGLAATASTAVLIPRP